MNKLLFVFLAILLSSTLFSQDLEDYYDDDQIRYDDYIYNSDFRSVKLFQTGLSLSEPIIELGGAGTLTLMFDDLSSNTKTYYYTFILCNADWTPADLLPMEYIDGVNEEYFNVNSNSFNTTTPYTNYQVTLPSRNMKLTKAGNYILKIYSDDDPEMPLITRRMYVVSNLISIETEYFMANAPQYRNTKQEMYVKVLTSGYSMPNVYENLTMVIQQNGRKDNIITKHQPKILKDDYLYYNTANDILFDGGNEFRSIDIRSLRIQSANIGIMDYDSAGYQVNLLLDGVRTRYLKSVDLNGNFSVINWDDTHLSDQIEADYANVNFKFKADSILKNGSVYIMGALTDWNINSNSKMAYNKRTRTYNASLLLKQGYYDYQYVYVPNEKNIGTAEPFEGNYSETVNKYTIYVYYRSQGDIWDKLIGYSTVNNNSK